MTSTHILAVALFAFSAGAFAQTPQAAGAAGVPLTQAQAQPTVAEPHQHRYVTIGRDRTKVHLDRPAARSGSPGAQGQEQAALSEPHQHRYVTIGRDRTRVHLDRPAERFGRSASAMGNSGASPAARLDSRPDGQDLKGGPN